jgi:prophage DNA circulation protein
MDAIDERLSRLEGRADAIEAAIKTIADQIGTLAEGGTTLARDVKILADASNIFVGEIRAIKSALTNSGVSI